MHRHVTRYYRSNKPSNAQIKTYLGVARPTRIGGRSGTKPAQFLYRLQRGLQSNQNAAFRCGQLSPNQHTQVFIHSMMFVIDEAHCVKNGMYIVMPCYNFY